MKVTHKFVAWFAGATLLVTLTSVMSFWTFRQIEEAAAVRKHTYAVMNSADEWLASMNNAETDQRGYLLTGDETFLTAYSAARDNSRRLQEELRQLTLVNAAQTHLDALAPLMDAKMAEMTQAIELRRNHDMSAALALVKSGQGKRLMDSIRAEMRSLIQLEDGLLAQREAAFESNLRQLFFFIVIISLLAMLFALLLPYFIYRESRQRLKNLVHLETQHLLNIQEETNQRLQQTNAILQVSEEKLAVTLRSIGDAVIATDDKAHVKLMNLVAEQLTGWTQAEAVGRPVGEIFRIINQETRQPSTIPVMETLAHGTIQGLANHTVVIARDGSECAIADSCAPILNRDGQVVGAVLVFRDVTEEYAVQQALRDSAALIQTILNTVVDGIITIHASGGIIERANLAAERMFGYAAAELRGQNLTLLIPELDQDQRNGSLEYYSASDEARAAGLGREVVGQRKDGSIFPLEIAVSEMWQGGNRYFTGVLRDITTRKQVEAERAQLDQVLLDKNEELENARLVAENANLAKSDFLSSMSHELRTPLNAILGFAQLMETGSPPPTLLQQRSIDRILQAGWYLLELINEILDLALIESGKATLSREPVSLLEVMHECQAMIEPQAQQRGIDMMFPRIELPLFVSADRTRVKQILINLLSNAIKYNKPGGAVTVAFTLNHTNSIRISVQDTGMGLTPEQLAQLFLPFNRLGKESSAEEGTGIGLVVTKRLVELMGGAIGAESTVGEGSVFWFELSLTTAPLLAGLESAHAALTHPQMRDGVPQRTLLYVEDNPANLELVEQLIARRPDLRLISAADGNLGIEFARSHQPALILMDINLPGIDGFKAMEILRADPTTAHIPIIALSANAVPRDIEKALEAGFFNYLTKPIRVNEFMDTLDAALEFSKMATGRVTQKEQT